MYTFKQYVILSEGNKNTHLEHIEDELINQGANGVEKAFELFNILTDTLAGHTETPVDITTKWDGAPAIFAGTDPVDGKFFVGTKGVFAKIPKLNKRITDINKYHGDVKRGDSTQDKSSLRKKLKIAYKYLKNVGIDGYVVQGDLLFTKDSIRTVTIDGKEHLVFKPNTITYAVPTDSELAQEISNAELGIVFHTYYTGGPTVRDMSANFGFKADKLIKAPGVWFDDATFKDVSGQINLTPTEKAQISEAIRIARNDYWQVKHVFEFLDNTEHVSDLKVELKAHINSSIRSNASFEQDSSVFAQTFIDRYIEKNKRAIQALKTEKGQTRRRQAMENGIEFLRDNTVNIEMMYDMYLKLVAIKEIFVKKLSNLRAMDSFIEQPDGSFKVTKPEGFVAVDHIGGAIKLVDRAEFSAANFNPDKKFA